MRTVEEYEKRIIEDDILLAEYHHEGFRAATIRMDEDEAIFVNSRQIGSEQEKLCILAHEYGHCRTGTTHSVGSSLELISRHEYRADKWAVYDLLPPAMFREALLSGITEPWELAEHFGVTEEFVRRAEYIYRADGILPLNGAESTPAPAEESLPIYRTPSAADLTRRMMEEGVTIYKIAVSRRAEWLVAEWRKAEPSLKARKLVFDFLNQENEKA